MTAKQRPALTFWQIWNMCFGFLGIQFGFALQNSNVSRIFQTLGASIDQIPLLWIAAPLTGLLVQPIVGYFSDRTWTRLGRRRPYFLVGALFASAALVAMPLSPALWVAAGLLWILDASINVSMEPFRAFVGDQLPPSQRARGYAMQSFFIGVGAVVASLLPWLLAKYGVSNHSVGPDGSAIVPDTVRIAFHAGAIVLFLAVLWTVVTTREYPPETLHAFADNAPDPETAAPATQRSGLPSSLLRDFAAMPLTMRRLAGVQFFSWIALFAMWIYTTSAVAKTHFGSVDPASAAYNEGANWVGVLFAAYNGFAALAALVIPLMARSIGLRGAHLVNLLLGALALVSIRWIGSPGALLLPMVGIGFAWASILSIPYALLSDSLPARKMGLYMGIFNFFIVIPQLVAASLLGTVLRVFFGSEPMDALLIGGVSFVVAALLVLRVPQRAT